MNYELEKSAKDILGFFYFAMQKFENHAPIINEDEFNNFLDQITDEWMGLKEKEIYSRKVGASGYQKIVERLRERDFQFEKFNNDPEFRKGVLYNSYLKFFDE